MPNTVSIYEPRTMMGVIRKMPPVHTLSLIHISEPTRP